jgi:hexosaminidase
MAHVVEEVRKLFPYSSVLHVGGDEIPMGVWQACSECRKIVDEHESEVVKSTATENDISIPLIRHIHRHLASLLQRHQFQMAGWQEMAGGPLWGEGRADISHMDATVLTESKNLAAAMKVFCWKTKQHDHDDGMAPHEIAERGLAFGYRTVLCAAENLYFDLASSDDFEEIGLSWAGYLDLKKVFSYQPFGGIAWTEDAKKNVVGIQGQIWGETATTTEALHFLAFPKLFGLAERAWASDEDAKTQAGWERFARAVGIGCLPRASFLFGIGCRVPPPGVRLEAAGIVHANCELPGTEIWYTLDGSEPICGDSSHRYEKPIDTGYKSAGCRVIIKFKAHVGTSSSATATLVLGNK